MVSRRNFLGGASAVAAAVSTAKVGKAAMAALRGLINDKFGEGQ